MSSLIRRNKTCFFFFIVCVSNFEEKRKKERKALVYNKKITQIKFFFLPKKVSHSCGKKKSFQMKTLSLSLFLGIEIGKKCVCFFHTNVVNSHLFCHLNWSHLVVQKKFFFPIVFDITMILPVV